jgi:RNA-directed DNA polymerase
MMPNRSLVRALARSFLAGEQTPEQIIERASQTLGQSWRWLRPLAKRYINAFEGKTRPRVREAVRFLLQDRQFREVWPQSFHKLEKVRWIAESQPMQPVAAARTWNVPVIETVGHLAEWLGVSASELQWFADLKGLGYKKSSDQLRHYHYRILPKTNGSIRLIEAPKSRLKKLQQQILAQILDKVPAHRATHGFVKGRSIKTFIDPHVGRRVVLRMDLKDYFPSFRAARIQTFFRTLGYPESVADLLGGICTNAAARDVWNECKAQMSPADLRETRLMYARPHLPQGASTSPALANLCTYRVDCRLSGLARAAGAEYTRYADDLAFSGDAEFEKRVERFSIHVAAILMEEGFSVNFRKTRIMRQGVRQHLAGLVANQHMNVVRADFDRLKAILTNCVRHGPQSQNREAHPQFRAHLHGRVGFVEMINPSRGQRLRRIFEQIRWQ